MIYEDPKTHLVYSDEGYWLPPICRKQYEVFMDGHRYLLVSGPRLSGKTEAILHKILKHAYDNPGARVAIFAKTTKTGKCVRENTVIQTQTGLKRASKIDATDGVIGLNHQTFSPTKSKIDSIWKEPSMSALILKTNKGYEITGSPNHPVWCYSNGSFQYLTLEDIKSSHGSAWIPIFSGGVFAPEYQKVSIATRRRPEVITINEDIAYLIGALTGDGCLAPQTLRKHAIGFCGGKPSIVERLKSIVKSNFPDSNFKFDHNIQWRIPSLSLKRLVKKLNLIKMAHEKTIPDAIIQSPKSVIRAYLQGLFDTDGTADTRGYVSFCSTSERLAKDVQTLLLAFGIFSDLRMKQTLRRDAWILSISGGSQMFFQEIGFSVPEKQTRGTIRFGKIKTGGIQYPPDLQARLLLLYKSRKERGYDPNQLGIKSRKAIQSTGKHKLPGAIGLKKFMAAMNAESDPILNAFYCSGLATWCRVESITEASCQLYDMEAPETHNYFGNGFTNHNSGGVWQDLTDRIIPMWQQAGIAFEFAPDAKGNLLTPKVTGDTRQNMFAIRSRFGPTSEVLLHSLEYAPEVDEKLRGTKWSLIWFSEIDQIAPLSGPEPEIRNDRSVFAAADAQLRMEPGVPYEAHQIIMDCNPPEDGQDHWLYDLFFRTKEDVNYEDKEFQESLHHIQLNIDDNPFLHPRRKANLYNQYAYRQSLLDRLYFGKWTRDTTTGHFSEMFRPEIHVLGEVNCPEEDREILAPTAAVKTLVTGLDLGDKNNAFVILEKMETKPDQTGKIVTKFAVLDELVTINEQIPLRRFVEAMVKMTARWSNYCKEEYNRKVEWRHWSDEAAFKHFRSAAEAYDYMLVLNFSGGIIKLKPTPKYKGSIEDRVKLLQHLLFEERIHFSAQLEECINMLKALRKGRSLTDYVYPKRHTHVFDALTYALQSEAPADEIQFSDVKFDRPKPRLVFAK